MTVNVMYPPGRGPLEFWTECLKSTKTGTWTQSASRNVVKALSSALVVVLDTDMRSGSGSGSESEVNDPGDGTLEKEKEENCQPKYGTMAILGAWEDDFKTGL